jgi:hypothetical protein
MPLRQAPQPMIEALNERVGRIGAVAEIISDVAANGRWADRPVWAAARDAADWWAAVHVAFEMDDTGRRAWHGYMAAGANRGAA